MWVYRKDFKVVTPLGHSDSCCYNFVLKKEETLFAKPDKLSIILMVEGENQVSMSFSDPHIKQTKCNNL